MRKKTIKYLLIPFLYILKFHYTLIYFTSSLEEKRNVKNDLINIHSIHNPGLADLIWIIHIDKYFKTLFFHRTKRNKLSRLFFSGNRNCFIIPYDVEIGSNFTYSHPYGTIINAKKIGYNFHCKHLTTIGNKNDDESQRPVIGNNVYLGASVNIIGPIVIGNNVIVGAGTTVTKSIPDNTTVIGNGCRFIGH